MHGTASSSSVSRHAARPAFLTHAIGYPTDSTASVAELVELVRPRLPSSRWLLLAESFSGLVAIRLAAEKPAGLLGLVLVASAARWSRLRRLRSAPMRALFSLPAPSALLEWLFLDDATAELLPAVRRAITASPPRVLAARFRELVNADVRSELGAVEVPVLYLQASRDRLARRAEAALGHVEPPDGRGPRGRRASFPASDLPGSRLGARRGVRTNHHARMTSTWTAASALSDLVGASARRAEPAGAQLRPARPPHRCAAGGARPLLEPLQSYCILNRLPALTCIVVSDETGVPGQGFSPPRTSHASSRRCFATTG
jgi:hypothetical protein